MEAKNVKKVDIMSEGKVLPSLSIIRHFLVYVNGKLID
jgi:hypothetical protein